MRWIERTEGLAVSGMASLGPLRLRLPAVLDSGEVASPPLGPSLSEVDAPAGERHLLLKDADAGWEISFPVLAPEVAPATGGVFATNLPQVAYLHAPFTDSALLALRESKPQLAVLGNGRALWNEGEPFVEALRSVRRLLGAEPLLWVPRVGLPHRLPLLAYLGVDITDTTEGLLRAAGGTFFHPFLGADPSSSSESGSSCDCASCREGGLGRLIGHARAMYRRSLAETADALRTGRLRELVEARLAAEPANLEHLRYADRVLAELLDERTPVTGTGRRSYVLSASHRRPEIVRFRRRFLERYRPPTSKPVLLLVPCSRTKPYRVSPSHRRFYHAMDGLPGTERIHLVSVSSPLGLVPRELEDLPPARHYDVPVTGEWSAAEQLWVVDGLRSILALGRYSRVVCHLDPVEYAFLREALPSNVVSDWTIEDHRTTSASALGRLRAALERSLEGLPSRGVGFRQAALDECVALAGVQFGGDAAARLFAPPVRLMGRPWFLRLTDGRQDLATLREERGLFHVTVAGAQRLGELLPRVEADPSLSLQGDLFVPGVRSADDSIRPGDSVALVQDGHLAGVGEAMLAGRLMREFQRGVAVKVRHHLHATADTDNTTTGPPVALGR